ncbi:hypothetical protein BBO99_00005467 [Phytophthora kernoviae]|uniref:Expansin-like EG45 domain-containing protein n=2 Tax=Phytophthora kernoviae TaxID=325452 RepID=A0A3R7H9T3_9STRA|nr:hypothetical protein G195_004826 [Phytophthora kernoviae 00238/432]KAG2523317.1 hypothetical protein JM16_004006 [Phytophthora kernoviae]KAG2525136.1 hypothetical protein JM18_003581 [Phytophthora kernoviae]RLN37978.1 hypothetical protein BBI17_002291 [Phytophthora kernoviae]RLN79162.1 hypothetical protein BBO99_00005467 [Phytophthora kernoviae]
MVSMPRFLALLALCTSAFASAEYYSGDGTTYTLSAVSSGNCNFMSAISIATTNYAALNNDQWDDLANCGRCAQVSCVDSRCADPTATAIVQIVDRCPECKLGDLDLSPTVFNTITGSDPSRLKIQWQFVDCPDAGTVKICLKSGSNAYWIAVQPTNNIELICQQCKYRSLPSTAMSSKALIRSQLANAPTRSSSFQALHHHQL